MSYALVQDVHATWEQYGGIARSLGPEPHGLLLHLAGPTDEGFRIIEIWESEDAWKRFSQARQAALESVDPGVAPRTVVRELRAAHLVVGVALERSVTHDWIAVGPGVAEALEPSAKER